MSELTGATGLIHTGGNMKRLQQLGSRLDGEVRRGLGRCPRCMTLSGVLLVSSWLVVALLAQAARLLPFGLIVASAVAVLATVLAVAHLVAWAVRRWFGSALYPTAASVPGASAEAPATMSTQPRGCGCHAQGLVGHLVE
jgi:hypothetical protein